MDEYGGGTARYVMGGAGKARLFIVYRLLVLRGD